MIDPQSMLPAQKSKSSAGDMTAHSDIWLLPNRHNNTPFIKQFHVHLAHSISCLYFNCIFPGIIPDTFHFRNINDYLNSRISYKIFETMTTTPDCQMMARING